MFGTTEGKEEAGPLALLDLLVTFTRSFSNQELEEVEKFFAYYSAFESKDKLILKESKAGSYSVKFMCEVC